MPILPFQISLQMQIFALVGTGTIRVILLFTSIQTRELAEKSAMYFQLLLDFDSAILTPLDPLPIAIAVINKKSNA